MLIQEVSLKHTLTDKEYADLAKSQARALDTVRSKKADLESVKKSLAGDIAVAEAEVQQLSGKIHTGWEMRNVRCLLLDERPEGYRLVVRLVIAPDRAAAVPEGKK